jgi:hypothetical protein
MEPKSIAETIDTASKPAQMPVEANAAQVNEKAKVQARYESEQAAAVRNADNVENAREMVKRLYEDSRLEGSQAITAKGSQRDVATDPEQQRVREAAEVRSAMAQDKAAAQSAQLKARRNAVQDKVTLAKEQNYRDHFESFALARDMIAMRDNELDKVEISIKTDQMLDSDLKSIARRAKVVDEQNVRRSQEQSAKSNKASSKRLDLITPGSFETQPAEKVQEPPDVNIISSLRQSHVIEVETGATSTEQIIEQTEMDRNDAAVDFDKATQSAAPESQQSSATESVSRVLTEMKDAAARNGLITLNSSERAEQVVKEVIKEARRRPEQAIASQSQVSLQAALKMLQ